MCAAGGIVNFEAADFASRRNRIGNGFDGGVAGVAHDFEDVPDPVRRVAAEAGPGDVVVDGVRLIELGPHIEQHQIAGRMAAVLLRSGS